MRRFFRFVLMAMVLIVVGLMSALTAMRVAIHGRETTVPNFVKLSPAEAERTAVTNGLSMALEGQFYSTEIAEGRIVSQQPAPGTRVRRGWRVRLAQSLGPQRVVIPNVLGESPRAAEINIRERGLELGTVAQIHLRDAPTDEIIAQSPPPNAAGVQSPKLNVLTAKEADPQAYVMPSFVGRSLAEAQAAIRQAGFKVNVGSPAAVINDNGSTGTTPNAGVKGIAIVIRQSPAAGQKVMQDTLITLETSQ